MQFTDKTRKNQINFLGFVPRIHISVFHSNLYFISLHSQHLSPCFLLVVVLVVELIGNRKCALDLDQDVDLFPVSAYFNQYRNKRKCGLRVLFVVGIRIGLVYADPETKPKAPRISPAYLLQELLTGTGRHPELNRFSTLFIIIESGSRIRNQKCFRPVPPLHMQ